MADIDKEKTCCFFGHRKIDETEELKNKLCEIIENLIVNEKIDTFLFGSKSQFDDLCHKITTEQKAINKSTKPPRMHIPWRLVLFLFNYRNYLSYKLTFIFMLRWSFKINMSAFT